MSTDLEPFGNKTVVELCVWRKTRLVFGRFAPLAAGIRLATAFRQERHSMDPLASSVDPVVPGPVVPVIYVGGDLSSDDFESLRAHRIGVLVAESAPRAQRLLAHFQVAAIVFATPDLHGLRLLSNMGVPVVVLAARDAACDLDSVTILRRDTASEDLAAVIHGLVRRNLPSARHAA